MDFEMRGNSVVRMLVICALILPFPPGSEASKELRGEGAPDFALKSMAGKNLRLSEYRGDVVVLSFWSSHCGKCMRQIPVVEKIYEDRQAEGLTVLGVAIDQRFEKARDMAIDLDLPFPVLHDERNKVSRLYSLGTLPAVYVIDRTGVVRYVHMNYRKTDRHDYRREVDELLGE